MWHPIRAWRERLKMWADLRHDLKLMREEQEARVPVSIMGEFRKALPALKDTPLEEIDPLATEYFGIGFLAATLYAAGKVCAGCRDGWFYDSYRKMHTTVTVNGKNNQPPFEEQFCTAVEIREPLDMWDL